MTGECKNFSIFKHKSTMENVNNIEQLDALVNTAAQKAAQTALEGSNDNAAPKAASSKPADSFISICSFSDFVKEGRQMEKPQELVRHVLVEHETTILFGDTGLGKSTLAMQMACEVAEQGKRVLYLNCELSQQQVAGRFPQKEMPATLFISCINYALMHDVTDQSQILGEIERLALMHDIEVVVIDNLTNLCINSKESSEAGSIMLQLISLRMAHNWTMLVLAHVPKRKPGDPLTLNDLAGSKILSNMADNVVGLNRSKKDKDMRYIIQLKYRSLPIELDCKNVQELTMTNLDGWLHFVKGGLSEEREHLPRSRDEKAELERDIVRELKEPNGLSYRDIADKLGTTRSRVYRVAQTSGLSKKNEKKAQ